MRLPISCTTSPTITSSSGLVVPSVVGSALDATADNGAAYIAIDYQTATANT